MELNAFSILTIICIVLVIINIYFVTFWLKYVVINMAGAVVASIVGILSFAVYRQETV